MLKTGEFSANGGSTLQELQQKINEAKGSTHYLDLSRELKDQIELLVESNKILLKNNHTFSLNPHEITRMMDLEISNMFKYLEYRYKFKTYPNKKILTEFPLHLLIEPISYCNLKCVMCFQVDEKFSKDKKYIGKMDIDLFKKCVDEARENSCRALTLASRGEPTLHPELSKMIEYCKPIKNHQFFDLKLNTNATRLNENLIHSFFESEVTSLVFSVDSDNKTQYERIRVGGKFEKVLKNIKMVKDIRDKHYPNSHLQTRVSGVLVENQSHEVISNFWSDYVDEVTLIRNLPRWDSYNNDILNLDKPCDVLWERMYVWYDGVCNPCDFDYLSKLQTGNVERQSISEIWKSEAYTALREKHTNEGRSNLNPCDRCPL
jgi:radical SAM protein with 4Fe4S-binding SPASM domain